MTPARRSFAMVSGAITVLLLGFVVAVAARSRPGTSVDDPLFEFDSRLNFDLGRITAWVVIVLAVLGAVLFALGLKQSKPRQAQRKRSYLGLVLGVIAFFLIFRYVRPFADGLLNPGEAPNSEDAVGQIQPGASGSSGWLFSLLLAAIVAAALTRVGISVRGGDFALEPEPQAMGTDDLAARSSSRPMMLRPGSDPRSRIFSAYYRFEDAASEQGIGRRITETANRHAHRVGRELAPDSAAEISRLVALYGRARFDHPTRSESDALDAEHLVALLVAKMAP